MWQYKDYLTISEDFIPVFTEDVDRSYKGSWKAFIPHEYMKEMLEKLILALERGHASDKRSLWLTGAYGTGKTFASFVIKHLLEDDIDEIEDYFQRHDVLKPLWPRFRALRENKHYLVVYRSASGHITSNRRLMIEIQQAIRDQLKAGGYTRTFDKSIMDQLLKKLSDTSGILNWEGVFSKYRGRFRTVSSAEEVVERLRAGDVRVGEQVATVLEEEGLALVDSPSDVKAWIKNIIDNNGLDGIIFIWDEFTEFFSNNVPVTPLQELAQSTAEIPFYFLLITHRALNQFTRIDEESRRKLLDRFTTCRLEMAPVTAYRLIGNVIEANSDRRDEWEAKRDSLWSSVDIAVMHINLLGERVKKEELKMMAPIHPFTAYLLATISSLYSSSQRTLFQFLKTDEKGSFQWFITHYPQDNWYWLTPDYLWQYFFEDPRLESIEAVSDILSHYQTNVGKLSGEEEERVFRVMLLLTALCRQTQGAYALLKPSLSVLQRMFVGTALYSRVKEVADSLCARGLMSGIPYGNDFEYIIPTTVMDQNKLQQHRQRVENSFPFDRMVNTERSNAEFAVGLKELLPLQGAAKARHPIQVVSARDLRLHRERIVRGPEKPYEIGVTMVVAQGDEHLSGSEDLAREISSANADCCILISQVAFGERRWDEWLNCRALSYYHEEMRDGAMKRYYDSKAKGMVDEWLNMVKTGRFRAFFRGRQDELAGCLAVVEYLEDIVSSIYPDGPEKLSKVSTLYNPTGWGKAGAEIGLGIAQTIQRPYRDVVDELQRQGLWQDGGLDRNDDHPLAKMKRQIEGFFTTQYHVSLKQLWEALQQPPYGLMPSHIGILLFGFLLRNYAQGYYYSDGVNSLPLNPNKLAELIEQVMKGTRAAENHNYTIRKMSDQGEAFCQMARSIFHLSPEEAAYPEEARKNMRRVIIELGYPLWTLIYYVQGELGSGADEDLAGAIHALSGILTYDRDELNDQMMKATVDALHPVRHKLGRILSKDRMQEGMRRFWLIHVPRLIPLMESLNMQVPQVMERLRALFNEDVYLWQEDRVKEKLPELVRTLDLIDALNCLCGTSLHSLDELRIHFRTKWFRSKLPLLCYKEGQSKEMSDIIDYLHTLIYRQGQELEGHYADDIRRLSDQIAALLSGGPLLTGLLVEELTDHSLSDQESTELYASLPDLSVASPDEVRRAILSTLAQQTKQKKVADLQQRWRALTNSGSPEGWSEDMRVPIQWVLEGHPHSDFFLKYDRLQHLSEKDIDEMLSYLNDHTRELGLLQDRRYILDKFVQAAAGDYAELVRRSGAMDRFQDYIYQALGGKVYQWPVRLNEVNRFARQWINENYRTTAYPQILKVIETTSPDDIKRFVKHLVSEDALVGARLLAAVEQGRKK